jgi:hypothetical protein
MGSAMLAECTWAACWLARLPSRACKGQDAVNAKPARHEHGISREAETEIRTNRPPPPEQFEVETVIDCFRDENCLAAQLIKTKAKI